MKIRFIFKGGATLDVECTECTINRSMGEFVGYEMKGISENKPLYINLDEVVAIVRMGAIS